MKRTRFWSGRGEDHDGAPAAPGKEEVEVALLRKEELERAAPPRPAGGADDQGALLGRGSHFEGKLSFEGTVKVLGTFTGEISSEGRLVVGEGAKVDGTIQVRSAEISGEVSGTVTTTGPLELKATAHVTGDLHVAALVVDDGAYFEGTVKMKRGG